MKFLLYYILRSLFVRLNYSDEKITLTKGLFLKRTSVLPLSAIVKITVRQTPPLRIFRAKEVTVFTHGGKIEFFLRRCERLPFIPEMPRLCVKPSFREVLFGALIDTRFLAGIAFFAAVLRRISTIISSDYFDRVISALLTTAEWLSELLLKIHVGISHITAFAAVFAACSWIFAFAVKLLKLWNFRVSRRNNVVFVKSGLFSLYEAYLIHNTSAAVCRKTTLCAVFGCAPVYYGKTMIYPAASKKLFERLVSRLLKIPSETVLPVKTPLRGIAGHCLKPLWVFGISTALLVLFYISEIRFARLLKTVLYCAVFSSGYIAVCGMLLMKNAESAFGERSLRLSYRRGTAVFCACFPREISRGYSLSQSFFQRKKRLCDYRAFIIGKIKYRARFLPVKFP